MRLFRPLPGFLRQGGTRAIVALGIHPAGLPPRTPAVFIRLADNGVRHLGFWPFRIGRTSRTPGLTITGNAGRVTRRTIPPGVGGPRPARPVFRLAAVFLQSLVAASVECFAAAQLRDGLLGLLAPFLAVPPVTIGDLVVESAVAFDGDGFHAALDPARLEAVVPGGIDVRRGNH